MESFKKCPKCHGYSTIKMYSIDMDKSEIVTIYACYDCRHRWEEHET
jgi:hypothetical protein